MHIVPCDLFRFDQSHIAPPAFPGVCAGISIDLLTHLLENTGPHGIIEPGLANRHAREYVRMLDRTADRLWLSDTPAFSQIRARLAEHQLMYGGPGPAWEHALSFDCHGAACILLDYQSLHDSALGGRFHRTCNAGNLPECNHMGLAVWAPGDIFVFDPNCGGMHFHWTRTRANETSATAVDIALEYMGRRTGSAEGFSRVILALKSLRTMLPFGEV